MKVFLFSFTSGFDRGQELNIPATQAAIKSGFSDAAQSPEHCAYKWLPNISIKRLADAFSSPQHKQIKSFQFSGHGKQNSLSFMQNNAWAKHKVPVPTLAKYLGSHKSLKLVVFDCCESQNLAKSCVSKGIPAAIGTTTSLDDQASPFFNLHFWKAIVAGKSIKEAFVECESLYALEGNRYMINTEFPYKLFGKTKNLNYAWKCFNKKATNKKLKNNKSSIITKGKVEKSILINESKGDINVSYN